MPTLQFSDASETRLKIGVSLGGFKMMCQYRRPMSLSGRVRNKILADLQYDVGPPRDMRMLAHGVAWKEARVGCVIADRAA